MCHQPEVNVLASPLRARREAVIRKTKLWTGADVERFLDSHGYWPEPYILPPVDVTLKINSSKLRDKEPAVVSLAKGGVSKREISLAGRESYRRLCTHIGSGWEQIRSHLTLDYDNNDVLNRVVSYSFPINGPIGKPMTDVQPTLRIRYAVSAWVRMVERDLARLAHAYRFQLQTDFSNFYGSIYTHSIEWALNSASASVRSDTSKLGDNLDEAVRSTNGMRTNGIPIGPMAFDVIAEIIAVAIDRQFSILVAKERLNDFVAVRFKDDYRILARTREDAEHLLSILQKAARAYHLMLNESKTLISALPSGLFRHWRGVYDATVKDGASIRSLREFNSRVQALYKVSAEYPNAGAIDKFLGELERSPWFGRGYENPFRSRNKVPLEQLPEVASRLLMIATVDEKAYARTLALLAVQYFRFNETGINEFVTLLQDEWHKDGTRQQLNGGQLQRLWIAYFLSVLKFTRYKYPGAKGVRERARETLDAIAEKAYDNLSHQGSLPNLSQESKYWGILAAIATGSRYQKKGQDYENTWSVHVNRHGLNQLQVQPPAQDLHGYLSNLTRLLNPFASPAQERGWPIFLRFKIRNLDTSRR